MVEVRCDGAARASCSTQPDRRTNGGPCPKNPAVPQTSRFFDRICYAEQLTSVHFENPPRSYSSQTRHASHACAEKEETACGQNCGTDEARTHCASPLGSRLLRICQTLQRFCNLQQHTPSITFARIGLSGVRPFRRSPFQSFLARLQACLGRLASVPASASS